ncbi:hypothetical protein OH809_10755 [Streptomyces sp. NBC_00873]|uniref:hypothetical protein n=1 Tax=unclassified Streptomyces TaxID=2593676 RepID=UPI003865BE9D|nr:hypothetical protein OH809_10755 [Streptomyces sp. NBC_00873]WTA46868.1 hypothetical protein OH821_33065 [Streptomyces sp. NBC_00842]
MNIDRHVELASNIGRSLARLGPDDHEMAIEAAMLAGTHWLNAALHADGVAGEDEDVVHCSMLVVNVVRKYAIAEPALVAALQEIEDLRPLHVRGDVPGRTAAGHRALDLLAAMRLQAIDAIEAKGSTHSADSLQGAR